MKLEEILHLRLPAETKRVLEALAVKQDRSVGWLVRHTLENYIREMKEKTDE